MILVPSILPKHTRPLLFFGVAIIRGGLCHHGPYAAVLAEPTVEECEPRRHQLYLEKHGERVEIYYVEDTSST